MPPIPPMPPPIPPGGIGGIFPPPLTLIRSSIFSIMFAASVADFMTCCFTRSGSMTSRSSMFLILPVETSMPKYLLSGFSCCALSATMMSMGSKPAFSANVSGIDFDCFRVGFHCKLFASADFNCVCRRSLATSASGAPPPATIFPSSIDVADNA